MALYKEITEDKGINSKYFRISKVELDIDNKKLNIEVKEYADKKYRETEKNTEKLILQIEEEQKKVNLLNENYLENEDEILKLNKNIESLVKEYNENYNKDLSVKTNIYSFDLQDKEYSLTICYNMLKTLEIFKNSNNI